MKTGAEPTAPTFGFKGCRDRKILGRVLAVALEEAAHEFGLGVDAEMAVDVFDVVAEGVGRDAWGLTGRVALLGSVAYRIVGGG
jgi:hypothetical protein